MFILIIDTVVCKIVHKGCFGLETRVIIKISKKNIPHMKTENVFSGKKSKKKIKVANQKKSFSSSTIFQYFFVKISWIGPLVSMIV